jgi:hypothetical protein
MTVNQRRIAEIMLNHCSQLEERCEGYHGAMIDALVQILELESLHRAGRGIPIRQRIGDQCETLGRFLAERREPVQQDE